MVGLNRVAPLEANRLRKEVFAHSDVCPWHRFSFWWHSKRFCMATTVGDHRRFLSIHPAKRLLTDDSRHTEQEEGGMKESKEAKATSTARMLCGTEHGTLHTYTQER